MTRLVIGCNYHTRWQTKRRMRFVLMEIKGDRVRLATRTTGKDFWTYKADLVFIPTEYNIQKANRLERARADEAAAKLAGEEPR